MKKFLLIIVIIAYSISSYAIPAGNVIITHTQKDGTVLTLRLIGDEHMHYYQNVATGQAMRKGADGDFVVISSTDLSSKMERAAIRRTSINQQRIARLPRMQQTSNHLNGPNRTIGQFNSMTGVKKGLVILVNFSDVTFKIGATSTKKGSTTIWDYTNTQIAFHNQFNQQGYTQNGHIGSVKDYFSAQSYGTFTVDFDVVGPITVSNTMAHYGAPLGDNDDSYPATMVIEACKAADAAGIDFSQYDWNGDGNVDQVFVIYAGYNEAQGGSENAIWPHEWNLNSARYFGDGTGPFKLDGKTINTYACTSELAGYSGTTMDGIGTACHEFSHCLGYPDLYDTDYADNGSGFGMSYYDLMAAGSYNGPNNRGEVPCGYSAYERWMAGWITPTELNADAATIAGMVTIDCETNGGTITSANATLASSPSRAYIIKNGSDNDYYLLENRPNTGYFKYFGRNTSGSGLFITHVNYNATAWQNNTVNAYSSNQRFIFIPADGTRSESSGYTTDFFPTSSVKSFTQVANKQVTNIAKSNNLISFDFNGGFYDDGTRYTVTLDACGGSVAQNRWTQSSYKETWTLPEPTTDVTGWYGAGWSLTKINNNTPLDDVDLIDYDKSYEPESNVTLYAVYFNDDFICNSYPANTHYTVTFDAGAGTCATTSWTQTDQQQKTSLPTASISIDGWTFAGWAEASVSETFTKPMLHAAGADYQPVSNVTLYAVYKKATDGNGKISSVDEITDGSRYVFVISDGTTSYAVKQNATDNYVSFTESDEFDASIIWTAASATNGYSFTCNNKYLYNSGDNTTINAASASATDWVFTSLDNNLFKMQRTNTSGRYIGWSGSKFAGYASNNFVNQITTSATLAQYAGALYIYKIGGSATYNSNPEPETTPGEGGGEENEGDDITITPISGIPAGYYNNTIVGKNDRTLELALKAIVSPHTKIGYNSLFNAFKTTDVVPAALLKDPSRTDQVYDMYANLNTFTKYYSDNDHTQTGGFNREHCVPNSWWGGESGNATAYTDLHHLVPGDGAANNAKANHPLGEYKTGMTLSWPTRTLTNADDYTYVVADNTSDHSGSWSHVWNTMSSSMVFEPADEFKGDFARMYLYVVCAYEGDLNWQTADNTMFSNGANNYTVIANDAKALLLKWHRQDPVSDKERLRNNAVQSIQGNRNPFIDYPVLVEYVWGDSIAKKSFSLETMPSAYQFGVTYSVGTDVTCSEQVRLCDRGSAVTLPTATTSVEGWTFCGWTTSPIENTTDAPTLLTGNYTPTENIKLYAVFQAGGIYSITPEALETPQIPDIPGASPIYFPHIAKLGQPFTAPTFSTNSDGAQTWTSSNTTVADVDNQGHVTIHAVGTTIITVTQAETATYKQGTASYMIKVVK